jgi:hypothetical protein
MEMSGESPAVDGGGFSKLPNGIFSIGGADQQAADSPRSSAFN